MKTIAERVRWARTRAKDGKLSARKLSDLAGLASGYVAMVEAGDDESRPPTSRIAQPRWEQACALASVLGVDPSWIMGGGPTPDVSSIDAAVAAAEREQERKQKREAKGAA